MQGIPRTTWSLLFLAHVFASCAWGADPIPLRAGPLSMIFEPDNAFLRSIRVGQHPVLLGISAPIRDQYWGTVAPQVTVDRYEQDGRSFLLTFDVSCKSENIDFHWRGRIDGAADGQVTFRFDGQAASTFLRNRIGFCVLHGTDAAGQPCVIEHTGGQKTRGQFPNPISPHQPFQDIRAISHRITEGVWAHVRMEGDTFEMEDQRNWTDASFKTYCTPLALPYPVQIAKGTKISHKITLRVDGLESLAVNEVAADKAVVVSLDHDSTAERRLPQIGLRLSSTVDDLSEEEVERLRALHLGHLRVDLSFADGRHPSTWRRALSQAEMLEVPLQVALHLGEDPAAALNALKRLLGETRPHVSHWLVIAANDEQTKMAVEQLRHYGGIVAAGQDSNFTELNRNRPDTSHIHAVSYGLNPQVHAFDNTSMVETLAVQADTVFSARKFTGDLPLLISPITLRPHRASLATPPGHLPPHVDRRQPTLFAAAWTLGSIKYLSEAGVDSLTYYETVGWLGVMESKTGTSLPDQFPSTPGEPFPVYYLLRTIGEFRGSRILPVTSADPMSVVGFALERDANRRVILANLSGEKRRVTLRGLVGVFDQHRLTPSTSRLPSDVAAQQVQVKASGELTMELPAHGITWLDTRD